MSNLNRCPHCGEEHIGEMQEQKNVALGGNEWRWVCSCGSKGQWTIQSPNVPTEGFRRHIQRHMDSHNE